MNGFKLWSVNKSSTATVNDLSSARERLATAKAANFLAKRAVIAQPKDSFSRDLIEGFRDLSLIQTGTIEAQNSNKSSYLKVKQSKFGDVLSQPRVSSSFINPGKEDHNIVSTDIQTNNTCQSVSEQTFEIFLSQLNAMINENKVLN